MNLMCRPPFDKRRVELYQWGRHIQIRQKSSEIFIMMIVATPNEKSIVSGHKISRVIICDYSF